MKPLIPKFPVAAEDEVSRGWKDPVLAGGRMVVTAEEGGAYLEYPLRPLDPAPAALRLKDAQRLPRGRLLRTRGRLYVTLGGLTLHAPLLPEEDPELPKTGKVQEGVLDPALLPLVAHPIFRDPYHHYLGLFRRLTLLPGGGAIWAEPATLIYWQDAHRVKVERAVEVERHAPFYALLQEEAVLRVDASESELVLVTEDFKAAFALSPLAHLPEYERIVYPERFYPEKTRALPGEDPLGHPEELPRLWKEAPGRKALITFTREGAVLKPGEPQARRKPKHVPLAHRVELDPPATLPLEGYDAVLRAVGPGYRAWAYRTHRTKAPHKVYYHLALESADQRRRAVIVTLWAEEEVNHARA